MSTPITIALCERTIQDNMSMEHAQLEDELLATVSQCQQKTCAPDVSANNIGNIANMESTCTFTASVCHQIVQL